MEFPIRPEVTMRLLLVRHGETADNIARTIGSRPPGPPLSAVGLEQATALAQVLEDEPVGVVHSSEALRAVQTARTLARALGVPHREVVGAHEIDAGELEGLTYAEALPVYMSTMQQWWSDREARIPGGENGREFLLRFDEAIASVIRGTGSEETAVVVSHEAAICVWAANTAENLDAEFSRTHGLRNTGIVALERSHAGGWTALSWEGHALER